MFVLSAIERKVPTLSLPERSVCTTLNVQETWVEIGAERCFYCSFSQQDGLL